MRIHARAGRLVTAALFGTGMLWGAPAFAADAYVWMSSPFPGAPYHAWTNAAHSIQTAVDYAGANGIARVLVTNGTYNLSAELVVSNAVAVQSLGGAAATTLDAQSVDGRRVLRLNHAGAVVDGFTLRNGRGSSQGGGVYILNGSLLNCRVQNNQANGPNIGDPGNGGGGLILWNGLVSNCLVSANSSTLTHQARGGGILMQAGLVVDCVVSNNYVDSYHRERGGGICMLGGTVDRCRIVKNRCLSTTSQYDNDGGGGAHLAGSAVLRNSIVMGNQTASSKTYGGGVRIESGTIQNCTITRNYSPTSAGGVHRVGGTVVNTIIYHNNAPTLPFNLAANASVTYSCAPELTSGTGNITADPLPTDAGSGYGYAAAIGDYHLRLPSPCRDTGSALAAVTTDLDRDARPLDGDGNGVAKHDIGADELLAASGGSFRCDFTAAPPSGTAPLDVAFTAYVAGPDTNVVTYVWDFDNDGTPDAAGGAAARTASHTYPVSGSYSVSLTVTNTSAQVATRAWTNYIVVAPPTLVSPYGSQTPPYQTWATAATNLQTAINATLTGGRVLVSNGTYRLSTTVNILSGVTVQSLSGPEATILDAGGQARVCWVNHAGAVLRGFTLRNGYAGAVSGFDGAGAGVYLADGLVENCIVRGNRGIAGDDGDGSGYFGATPANFGGGVWMSFGTLRNCVVVGNQAGILGNDHGGGVAISGGAMEHCTIMRNRASGSGGGVYKTGGTLANCVIAENRAASGANINTTSGVTYSCSPDLTSGTGNVAADPRVAHEGCGWGVSHRGGDFRLALGSPCLDSGTALAAVTKDILGAARPADGDSSLGAVCDMGAYETQLAPVQGAFRCHFRTPASAGFAPLTAEFTAAVAGTNTSGVSYTWDLTGDGSPDAAGTDRQVVTNQYVDNTRWHTVTLTCQNEAGEIDTCVRTNYVQMHTDVAYVSKTGTHTPPFATWATAATRVQDAVDEVLGVSNPTVLVAPETYQLLEYVGVAKPLTVRSRDGAAVTTLRGPLVANVRVGAVRHANAVLDGFTVTDGRGGGQGGGIWMNSGTVRNCIIRGNATGQYEMYIGGGGIYASGGSVTNCTIRNNYIAEMHMAWGGGIQMDGGVMSGCTVVSNYVDSVNRQKGGGVCLQNAARAERCLILYNEARAAGYDYGEGPGGGGVWMQNTSVLRNCLVAGNRDQSAPSNQERGGGGVYLRDTPSVQNCTIVRNQAIEAGGGIFQLGGTVLNSIVYDNTAPVASNLYTIAGVTYTCAPEATSGTGNITGNPNFRAAGANYGLSLVGGDFRPQLGSPCLNIGLYQTWMDTAVDLDGRQRLLSGAVDLGAYEIPPPGGTLLMLF